MKKFGFASLLLALSFAQLGCGEPESTGPEPSLSPAAAAPEGTPAPGAVAPAPEGDAKPAEGDAKPAEGDAPDEGDAKPAEGDAPAK